MAVVVDDQDAVRLAAHVEAPFGAAELLQAGGDAIERQPELEADGDRRQRVQQVVAAGHVQASAARASPALRRHRLRRRRARAPLTVARDAQRAERHVASP